MQGIRAALRRRRQGATAAPRRLAVPSRHRESGVLRNALAIFLSGAALAAATFVVAYHWAEGTNSDRFDVAIKSATAVAAVAAGLLTWGRLELSRNEHDLGIDRDLTERYSRAIEHLSSPQELVRVGGIFALERFALDAAARSSDDQVDWRMALDVIAAVARNDSRHAAEPKPPRSESEAPPTEDWDARRETSTTVREALRVLARFTERSGRHPIPPVAPDLTGATARSVDLYRLALVDANLTDSDLSGANLIHVNFDGANLTGANLTGANLHSASLRSARLRNTNLGGANLTGANLDGANLDGADLTGANLHSASLRSARLRNTNLGGANLKYANLNEAKLSEAMLQNAILDDANLSGADLSATKLHNASLHNAILDDANLSGADLSATKLHNASLRSTRLFKANLSEAILQRANFGDANLHEAMLHNADLGGANLSEAILFDADLSGASLFRTTLTGVGHNERTIWPEGFSPPSSS